MKRSVIKLQALCVALVAAGAANAALPSGYTQFSCIRGWGDGQIVINDYTPTPNNDKIEAVLEFPTLSDMCVWCARGSEPTDATWSLFVFTSQFRFDYNNSAGKIAGGTLTRNTQYTVTAEGPAFTWSGGAGATHTYSNDFTSAGGPLVLFAAYSNGIDNNKGYYADCKLYSFKIWRSGELIHDLVPATRLIESRVRAGLYDVKKDKFYAASGSCNIGDVVEKRGFILIVR